MIHTTAAVKKVVASSAENAMEGTCRPSGPYWTCYVCDNSAAGAAGAAGAAAGAGVLSAQRNTGGGGGGGRNASEAPLERDAAVSFCRTTGRRRRLLSS